MKQEPVAWWDGSPNNVGGFSLIEDYEFSIPLYTKPQYRELERADIYGLAMEAGFMLSTQYGQEEHKLMPVTDGSTLVKLAELILKKASEK